jgi:hypothetical protein
MRPGGGKQKGAQFERDICVHLSKWITSGASADVFWRSAMSGGRATVAMRKQDVLSNQVGDLSCIDPAGHHFINAFIVECKFYSDLNITGLLTGKGKLLEFWGVLKKQSRDYHKFPMLVARQNRMQSLVCFDKSGLCLLGLYPESCELIAPKYDLHILGFTDFLKRCKPFKLEL